MKKSVCITLTLMTGLAAACADDRPDEASGDFGGDVATRQCVDRENRVVPDEECTRPRSGGMYPFFFYYGGRALAAGGATYMTGGTRTDVGAPPPRAAGAASGARSAAGRGAVSRGGLGARGMGRGVAGG